METDTKHNGMKCDCGCSGCGGGTCGACTAGKWGMQGHHYSLVRLLLKIIILCVVFSAGMHLGEIKGYLEANGYSDRGGWNHNSMMNGGINGTYPYGGSPQSGGGLQSQ